MGRHVNPDAVVDGPLFDEANERARHAQLQAQLDAQGHPLEAQAVISADTHVGTEFEVAPGTPDAPLSPAHPDALIQHGLVGDGHELE